MGDLTRIQSQIDSVDKATKKGISFIRRNGCDIEYVNIPSVPDQKFVYFYKPPHFIPPRVVYNPKIIGRFEDLKDI